MKKQNKNLLQILLALLLKADKDASVDTLRKVVLKNAEQCKYIKTNGNDVLLTKKGNKLLKNSNNIIFEIAPSLLPQKPSEKDLIIAEKLNRIADYEKCIAQLKKEIKNDKI